MTPPLTLDALRDLEAGAAYPGATLEGSETALILFAAGFYGRQDAYWVADAGLIACCIDKDADKLAVMEHLYPRDWAFVKLDVFNFATKSYLDGIQWDVVSLDPWTHDFDRCAETIKLWCNLARRVVILGTGAKTKVEAPDGWRITERRHRSDYDGGVYWTVLENR